MKNKMIEIQKLPKSTRKIILWSITAIIVLGLLVFYIKNVQKKIEDFEMRELRNDLLKFEMPKIEVPEHYQEELKELEKIMEEAITPK